MTFKPKPVDTDGYPIPNGTIVPGPLDGEGKYTNAGFYIPTEEEYRERFPDISPDKDISNERIRLQAWVNPGVRYITNAGKEHLQNMQKKATKAGWQNKETKQLQRERKQFLLETMKEELSEADRKRIKPRQILQVMMEDAYLGEEKDLAVSLAIQLLPYDEAKIAPVKIVEDVSDIGKASEQDLDDFISGDMSAEEFERRTKEGNVITDE